MEMVNKLKKPIKSGQRQLELFDKSIDAVDESSSKFSKNFSRGLGQMMGRVRVWTRENLRGHNLVGRAKARLGQIAERVDDELDTGFGNMIKKFGPLAAGVGTLVAMGKAGISSERSITQLRKSIKLTADQQEEWSGMIHQTMIEFGDTREEAEAYFAVAAKAKVRGKDLEYFTRAAAKMTDVTELGAEAVGDLFVQVSELYDLGYDKLENFGSAFKHVTETTKLSNDALADYLKNSRELIERIPEEMRSKFLPAWMAAGGAIADVMGDPNIIRDAFTKLMDPASEEGANLAGMITQQIGGSWDDLIKDIEAGNIEKVMMGLSQAVQSVPMDQLKKGTGDWVELFGGISFEELTRLRKLGPDAMGRITKSTQTAFDQGTRLSESWKEIENTVGELWNRIKAMGAGFLSTFGTPLISVLSTVVGEYIFPLLKAVGAIFNILPGGIKKVIGLLGGIAAVMFTISMLSSVIGVSLSPILIPLVAITAALVGIIALFKNWKKIVNWVWRAIKTFVNWVVRGVKWIIEAVKDVWDFLKKWVPAFKLVDATAKIFIKTIQYIWDAMVSGVRWAWDKVKSMFTGIWDFITGFFSDIGNWISGMFTGLWNGIKNALISVLNWGIEKINWLIKKIPDILLPEAIEEGIPLIPTAQHGAFVKGTREGTTVTVGERNTPEVIIPLHRLESTRAATAKGNEDVVEAIHWLAKVLVRNSDYQRRRLGTRDTDRESMAAEGFMI
jgi:hypothetical protein